MCMSGAQKDVGSLELEFWKDVSHHVGTKSLGPLPGAASALNGCAILSSWLTYIFIP